MKNPKMTLFRRSGIGLVQTCEAIGWRPDVVYQVGVGGFHQEVNVMLEEWPDVRFIGMEPNRRTCRGLVGPPNQYPGDVYQMAISDRVGFGTFHLKSHHLDGSSLLPIEGQPDCETAEVRVVTLDFLFTSPPIPDERVLLWLDCEGSELAALRGGQEFVRRVGVVNVEMSSAAEADGNHCEVHRWLRERGFLRQWVHTHRIHAGQVDAVYVRRNLHRPEVSCDPYEI